MHTHPTLLIAIVATTGFMLAQAAQGQCSPQRLDASQTGFRYGTAMAMNEDHLIVGDSGDTSLCTVRPDCGTGKVYAYQRGASGEWVYTQEVKPAALAPYFAFGGSLDLDGDRLIVGSPGPGAGGGLGAAYIFEYDGEQWVETAELLGVRNPPYIGFGGQVAINGDLSLVTSAAGIVYVFHDDGTGWDMVDMLRNPDSPDVRSDFGYSLDINDERVVIGADLERTIAPNGGAVYMYLRQPNGGLVLEQKLIAPDVMSGPRFGTSVSLDGHRLAVGAELAERTAEAQGVVYMHEFVDAQWQLTQELVASDAVEIARFGRHVFLSGGLLAIGAPTQRLPDRSGAAFLFELRPSGLWTQVAEFGPEAWQIDFGSQVGLGAATMAVGAPRTQVAGKRRGSVSVFNLSCINCPPDIDADGALTIYDFLTFLNLFQDGDAQADFDGDGELTIFDFQAFQAAFDAGC